MTIKYYADLLKVDVKQKKWGHPCQNLVHGLYSIQFKTEDIYYFHAMGGAASCYLPGNTEGDFRFVLNMERDISKWLKAMENGNIKFDAPYTKMIGRFVKKGSQVFFELEEEECSLI